MANISFNAHPEEEVLERYALGKLDESAAAPIEEHVLVCHECQDRLAAADDYIHTLKAALPALPPERVEQPSRRFWQLPGMIWAPALAAVVVFAIILERPDSYSTRVVELRSFRGAESSPVTDS